MIPRMRTTRRLIGALARRTTAAASELRHGISAADWVARAVLVLTVVAGIGSAANAEDRDWPIPAKNYANTRYSDLSQITRENVKSLKLAWTFDTGARRGQEAAPIVVGQTMY